MADITINDIIDTAGNVDPTFQALFGTQTFESEEDAKTRGLIIDGDNKYIYKDYKNRRIPMLCKIEIGPASEYLVKPFGAWINSRWDNTLFDCAANMGIWIDVTDETTEGNWKDLVVECLNYVDPQTGRVDYIDAAKKFVTSFFNIDAQVCYPDGLVNGIYDFLREWFKPITSNVTFRDKLYQTGGYNSYQPGEAGYGFPQFIIDELNNHFPGITPLQGPASNPYQPWMVDYLTALPIIVPYNMKRDNAAGRIIAFTDYNLYFKCRVNVIRDEYGRKQYKFNHENSIMRVARHRAGSPIEVTTVEDAEGNYINKIVFPSDKYVDFIPSNSQHPGNDGYTWALGSERNENNNYLSVGGFQILSSQEDSYYDVWISLMNYEGTLKPFTQTSSLPLTGKGLSVDRPNWGLPIVEDDPEEVVYPTPHRNPSDEPGTPEDDYTPAQSDDPEVHPIPEPTPIPPTPIPEPAPPTPYDVEPPTEVNEDAFIHIYHPNKTELDTINSEMWEDDAIAEFKKWWSNNPIDGIVSLHKVFIPVTNKTSKPVVMGTYTFDTSCHTVDRYQSHDLGTIQIPRYFNNYRDFDATISIYLPGIGFRDLDINDVTAIHGTTSIHIVYKVDIFTGDFIAYLEINKGNVNGRNGVCQYMFDGNIKCEYPLSGASRSGLVSGIIGTVGNVLGGAVGGAVTGGPAGAAVGAGKGLISSAGDIAGAVKQSIQKSGSLGGTLSALSIKYPFAIISRPIPYDNEYHDQITGRATNQCVLVRSMSGLTSFKDIHVDIPRASDTENYKILQYLKEGIIV